MSLSARQDLDLLSPASPSVKWCYQVDDAGWRTYPEETSEKIEKGFLHFLQSKSSDSSFPLDLRYTLCFKSMSQTNNTTFFTRLIRRLQT